MVILRSCSRERRTCGEERAVPLPAAAFADAGSKTDAPAAFESTTAWDWDPRSRCRVHQGCRRTTPGQTWQGDGTDFQAVRASPNRACRPFRERCDAARADSNHGSSYVRDTVLGAIATAVVDRVDADRPVPDTLAEGLSHEGPFLPLGMGDQEGGRVLPCPTTYDAS